MLMLVFFSVFINQAFLSSSIDTSTFSFSTFTTESCSNGNLLCMGSVTAGNGYLSITPEPQQSNSSLPSNKIGRVLYPHPVLAWPAIITTTFTIRISRFPNSSGAGDGMTFIFAQDNNPSPPGSFGSYLGLLDRSTQGGVVQQLAVELDTFMNEFDPDDNHIGLDTTSITNSVATGSLYNAGIDLKSGRDIKVKIDYDGWSNQLLISMGYTGNRLVRVLNHSIIMSDTVPSSVYVGFTASTGPLPESHQVLSWMFTSVPIPLSPVTKEFKKDDKIKTVLIIVIPVLMGLFIALVSLLPLIRRSQKKENHRNKINADIENLSRTAANAPKMFTYKQLSKATRNFSRENLLGRGGFGSVYKAIISDPPVTIAVKRISATSRQGEREYLAEICTIGRLRHRNIVKLLGWSHEGEHLLLVYEYMQNGSLDRFIGAKDVLEWKTRYNILTGLASALLYLHEECGNPVVHRDVKPNNVMLDSKFHAHLGDFGLARLLQNEEGAVTTILAGTPGYLAPEVGFTGKATPESDVYSFGMVVLEVVCGRRSKGVMEENSLVDYVWNLNARNALLECVDRLLENKFNDEQVKRTLIVGLACLHPDCLFRPKMRKVVHILLNPNEPLIELPEMRPSAVYVSVSSSTSNTTDFGTRSAPLFIQPSIASSEELSV
ncbi:Lectin receptor kinase [Quillaja saponaria]|uniref:non-specific serine/threonine protein kinase n=1 Tax=Quillaja saponaria TaxID=32244 RepID=A0AAD7LXR9_QUISA|nr:Lectin receptor kinase [Quillaja saponaria]